MVAKQDRVDLAVYRQLYPTLPIRVLCRKSNFTEIEVFMWSIPIWIEALSIFNICLLFIISSEIRIVLWHSLIHEKSLALCETLFCLQEKHGDKLVFSSRIRSAIKFLNSRETQSHIRKGCYWCTRNTFVLYCYYP